MPTTTIEKPRRAWAIGPSGIASRGYETFGTDDIEEVRTEILATAPTDWLGLPRDDENIQIAEAGRRRWTTSVPYTRAAAGGIVAPAVFSFSTRSDSQKLLQAPLVQDYGASPGPATIPDFRDAINVDDKGKCEGVDAPARAFDFEMEQNLSEADLTNSFLATLVNLCTKYNDAAFRGFAAGEVLYLGCTGCPDNGGRYRLNHAFKASPNLVNASICNGTITGVNKKGHQYLWLHYKRFVENNLPVLKPQSAYVHEVTAGPGDFSLIGLPT